MPNGIAAGPDGNLWFTEYNGNKIGRITPFTEYDGSKIGRLTPTGQMTAFPLPYSGMAPEQIVLGPDGNLWFTDFGNGDIGRINP